MAKRLTLDSDPIHDYAAELERADSLEALRFMLRDWEDFAWDAMDAVKTWGSSDFQAWRRALVKERKGNYMGDTNAERFGMVLLPEMMVGIGMVAVQYKVPFVVARDRLIDVGYVKRQGRRLIWTDAGRAAFGSIR